MGLGLLKPGMLRVVLNLREGMVTSRRLLSGCLDVAAVKSSADFALAISKSFPSFRFKIQPI
jgi:hypothetical protein